MNKIKKILDKIPNIYKTFCWNLAYQLVVFTIKYIIDNLAQLNIPAEYAVVVGLILSQISKYLAQSLTKK